MNNLLIPILAAAGGIILILLVFAVMVSKFYVKVAQGRALIINKVTKQPTVTFTGGLVIPIIHKSEVMDISVKTIEILRRGTDGLICKDNIRADIKVTFFVKVNNQSEDVLKVAGQVGCARASDQETLEELFSAKFSEALKTAGKQLQFIELYEKRDNFKDQIVEAIGTDLNGYVLDDAAIDYLEQTPLQALDKDNILDAEGIKKITELTTAQSVLTNELRRNEEKTIKKQDVEAREATLALERQQADAEAKQSREIATTVAREAAETAKVQAEERKKAEEARIKSEEEIAVAEEAKQRQVEVAVKNRERVIGVETERVEKDRQLEQIARERETELQQIEKQKALEIEKKAIADVVRARVAVDKTVAEEEERIKDTRAIAEAKRNKEVAVTAAQAEAEELLTKQVREAEAMEEVAKHKGKERLILADAQLEASDREAKAKIRLSEGVQAEAAAAGLAEVKVREADAIALEKEGAAKARVTQQSMEAEAAGAAAKAAAIEKTGLAEAKVTEQAMLAKAKGIEEQGLAGAKVQLAEADAVEKRAVAEATGLKEKAAAMKALDGAGRAHEEFRLRLEQERQLQMAAIDSQVRIADARAKLMGAAFDQANINIVGGDGQFFDRFVNAVSVGKSVDGFVDSSDRVQQLFGDYLGGQKSLPAEVMETVRGFSSADLQQLTVSGLLTKLMIGAPGDTRDKLTELLGEARKLGLADKKLS